MIATYGAGVRTRLRAAGLIGAWFRGDESVVLFMSMLTMTDAGGGAVDLRVLFPARRRDRRAAVAAGLLSGMICLCGRNLAMLVGAFALRYLLLPGRRGARRRATAAAAVFGLAALPGSRDCGDQHVATDPRSSGMGRSAASSSGRTCRTISGATPAG